MRADCPACGQPVPLNAPAQSAHCAACARDFALPPAVFAEVLLRFDDAYPAKVDPFPKGADGTIGELSVHATYPSGGPVCEKCGHELALAAPPSEGTVTFACAACGDPAACYPAPDWLRALVPTATHIAVADTTAVASSAASQPRHDESRPVLMPCPGCGASLKLTSDTTRTLQCGFCKNDVYLPDDLWRRLHPVRTVAPWYVRFEGVSRGEFQRGVITSVEHAEQAHDQAVQESAARRKAAMDDLMADAKSELQAAKDEEAGQARTWAIIFVVVFLLFFLGVFGFGFLTHKF